MGDHNVEVIITKLRARSEQGVKEYGVTTDKANLTTVEWLSHLQEELLDSVVYIQELLRKENENSVLALVAEFALKAQDYEACFGICELLMESLPAGNEYAVNLFKNNIPEPLFFLDIWGLNNSK